MCFPRTSCPACHTAPSDSFPAPCPFLGPAVLSEFDYVFAENGLVAYKAGQLLAVQSLSKHLGEANLKDFINFCLKYLAGKAGCAGGRWIAVRVLALCRTMWHCK